MPETTHTFDHKPWLTTWFMALSTVRNTEQALGLWLAYLADDEGILSRYSWDELAGMAGMQPASVRDLLRNDRIHCDLVDKGLVERKVRRMGRAYIIPKLTLHLDVAAEVASEVREVELA